MNILFASLLLFNAPLCTDSLQPTVNIPQVNARVSIIKKYLEAPVPICPLDTGGLDAKQQEAQQIVLSNSDIKSLMFDPETHAPLRNEIFAVYPTRPSDYSVAPECADGSCYRVEIYNYALNNSVLAIAQLSQKKVTRVWIIPQTQPDIPQYLKDLALDIAVASPEVEKELGFKPTKENALMSDTKTALNRTRCERSKHLCVAPTFVKGNRALWAIIDLTDMRLAGLRWTNVGGEGDAVITERKIQNASITECYCKKSNIIDQDGWKMNYILTSSDGLRISEVDYQDKRIIRNAKLVDWHVSYSNTDGFGYSDAVGCPIFSSSAVVAIEKPRVEDIMENGVKTGFSLTQNFVSENWPTPCNYNYEQRFEFYLDGRFRLAVASLGRGCGNNGTYRPVTRIAFEGKNQQFAEWRGSEWKTWEKEGWQSQQPGTPYTPEGYQYRLQTGNEHSGFDVLANNGQMNDGGRGDQAYIYVTRHHPDLDEGEADLITIGPCCNTDYQQGPEKFIEPVPEKINGNGELVLWYVAQIKNDDREGNKYCWAETEVKDGVYTTKVYPCYSGAMFVPLK